MNACNQQPVRRWLPDRRGTAVVEFALIAPLFLLLLRRSPAMLAMLVLYPLLVALLAALALKGSEATPRVALVNLDTPGVSVSIGDRRLSVDDYVSRLGQEADVSTMSASDAAAALDAGQVDAVLTIPSGFIGALQSGVQQPHLRLDTNPRAPLEGEAITRRLQGAVYRFNQELAGRYVEQVVRLSDLIINGGSLGVFGRNVDVIGLVRSDALIRQIQADARREGRPALAQQLDPLLVFINQTRANLGLVRPAATSIASPIVLDAPTGSTGRAPLTAFGVAAAVLVSIGLASILLGAAGIASEREDGTLTRLRMSGVPMWGVALVKAILAAVAAVVIGVVLLALIVAFTDVTVGRWELWVPALLIAGAACGGLGTLIGSAVREARSALLVALLVSLPLLFLGMVPGQVGRSIAGLLPFGRAFDLFRDLLSAPSPGWPAAVHGGLLCAMVAVTVAASGWLLRTRDSA